MCEATGLPGAPVLLQRICKVTQGGKFAKEEPNAAAVAPQACLESIRVWVCCVLLVGGQAVLKEGRREKRSLERFAMGS